MVSVGRELLRKMVVEACTVRSIMERLAGGEPKLTEDLGLVAHEVAIAAGLAPEGYFDDTGNAAHECWCELEDEADAAAREFYVGVAS